MYAAALAVRLPDAEINEEKIAEIRGWRLPITGIPRRPVSSFCRGLQIILDRREPLTPFFGDQTHLVNTIRRIAGNENISVVQFVNHPRWVFDIDKKQTAPYSFPVSPVPILLVSDLGIRVSTLATDFVSPGEWVAFAQDATKAHCPVVALVPYPPHRWPAAVTEEIITLEWDRNTTAGAVRRRIGPGLELP